MDRVVHVPGPPELDFAVLFRSIPTPYLVMTPDLVMVEANPAYLSIVGRCREELVGRHVFEVFPPPEDALDEHGVPRVQVSWQKVVETGRPDTMPIQKYDIPDPVTGERLVRYWSLIAVPVHGPDGQVAFVVQRTEDITDFLAERGVSAGVPDDVGQRRRVEEVEADLYARAQELEAAVAAEEAAGRRVTGLAELALALTGAESLDDLRQVMLTRGLQVMGADGVVITVPGGGGTLDLLIDAALGASAQDAYATLPEDSPLPAARCVRTGERLLMPDRAAGLAVTAEMAQVYETTGRQAWACLPLLLADEVLGSLAVAWTEPRPFEPADVELLEGMAAQCAQVLARLRAREQERAATAAAQRMSETLQRSLLTSPPAPGALRIAVRYQPAAQEAQVGGDWYDAFVTAAGSTLLVVGDVNGHDQTAAATMGQVRNLLRGMAYDSDDGPAVLLGRLDAALHGLQLDTLATAVLARVEQSASDRVRGVRRLRWSNAGHPPPLLRRADGSVQVLEGEPDLLLGLDPRTNRGERVVEVSSGCTLLLYTDGLVERRDAGLDEGVARLAGVLAAAGGGTADELCDALLDAVGPDGNDDDIALLVLQVDDAHGSPGART